MSVKVAVNGTGRIGLCVIKIVMERDDMELVALNTTADPKMLECLLKYDTIHKGLDAKVIDNETIEIAGKPVKMFSERDIEKLNFGTTGAEVVAECTGVFLTTQKAKHYLKGSVKKVVMSAPAKDDTPTFVLGANEDKYTGEAIVSNASCTTNGLAPVAKVLDDAFGIEKGLMTTIHSYTGSQPILDAKHKKDPRKSRAGATNLVPTTTGAAKAIGKVMPHLNGKLNGQAIRVPTPNVSMIDLTVTLNKNISLKEVQDAFIEASKGKLKGILGVDTEKRVSSDFNGEELSTVVPLDTIQVIGDNMVKVLSWYDNEWGYSNRIVEMAEYILSF